MTRLQAPEHSDRREPIAIVGLSCKLPGDAVSPQSFWELLLEGRNVASTIPEDRLNIDAFHGSVEPQRFDRVRRSLWYRAYKTY